MLVQRIVVIVLLLLVVLLQLRLWGADGQVKVDALNQAIAEQKAENEKLMARNAALEAEVMNLKGAREAIEERARAELGLIAEDEVFYHVIEGEGAARDESGPERRE